MCDYSYGRVDCFFETDLGPVEELVQLVGHSSIWSGYDEATGEVDFTLQPQWARLYDEELQQILDDLEEPSLQHLDGAERRRAQYDVCQSYLESRHLSVADQHNLSRVSSLLICLSSKL